MATGERAKRRRRARIIRGAAIPIPMGIQVIPQLLLPVLVPERAWLNSRIYFIKQITLLPITTNTSQHRPSPASIPPKASFRPPASLRPNRCDSARSIRPLSKDQRLQTHDESETRSSSQIPILIRIHPSPNLKPHHHPDQIKCHLLHLVHLGIIRQIYTISAITTRHLAPIMAILLDNEDSPCREQSIQIISILPQILPILPNSQEAQCPLPLSRLSVPGAAPRVERTKRAC